MDDATVVWLDAAPMPPDAARALAGWGRARGVTLKAPEDAAQAIQVDHGVAEDVERELDRAREAIGASDVDVIEKALTRAETLLKAHPELPQAAWLRAEVERTWSSRWARVAPKDDARAARSWAVAQALDGGRVFGIGEASFPPLTPIRVTFIVAHAVPNAQLTLILDGKRLETTNVRRQSAREEESIYTVEIPPTDHHLNAMIDRRLAHASWVSVATPNQEIRVSVVDSAACARDRFDELTRAYRANGHADLVTTNIGCPSWIAVAPGPRKGSIVVARCERDGCSPLIEWRNERLDVAGPPQHRAKPTDWPSWATWTLLGIGAATATSMAIVATGVLEARPVEPRFVVGGARQE